MADLYQSIAGFLEALVTNPAYLFLSLGFIALLILWLTVRHIRKIRGEDIWVHQAWGAKWKGR